jgi:hypothetical protein
MILKWQREISDKAHSTSNNELFDWLLECASGDDYDGGFTDRGFWEFEHLKKEMRERLIKSGFLIEGE